MRNRWSAASAAAAAALLALTGCGSDESGAAAAGPHYYLSLGDSITVGVQPGEDRIPQETSESYTDMLYRHLYDSDSTLRHERIGCGGEDTTTFLEGGLPSCEKRYDGAPQIEAAEDFLSEHEGQVSLVTVTIGGNNFTRCVKGLGDTEDVSSAVLDTDCVDDGLERIESEAPEIADRLRTAAGPDTQIIGMTYYNPFLAAMLLEAEAEAEPSEEPSPEEAEDAEPEIDPDAGPSLAEAEGELPLDASLGGYATDVLEQMNESLRSAYAAADIQVADVEAAFDSTDFDVPEDSGTGWPANVQAVCDLTWMCNTERGPDIHPNSEGARVIAEAFRFHLS